MSLASVVALILSTINRFVGVLVAAALAIFFWGIVRYMYKSGSKETDKDVLIWGLITLFVAVSIWGILKFMCLTFFDNPQCNGNVFVTGTAPPPYLDVPQPFFQTFPTR